MKKLHLNIDDIRVESFAMDRDSDTSRGTVRGLLYTERHCTVDLDCYTQDPRFYDCTGGSPCTDGGNCTYGACSEGCWSDICA